MRAATAYSPPSSYWWCLAESRPPPPYAESFSIVLLFSEILKSVVQGANPPLLLPPKNTAHTTAFQNRKLSLPWPRTCFPFLGILHPNRWVKTVYSFVSFPPKPPFSPKREVPPLKKAISGSFFLKHFPADRKSPPI